MGRVCMATGVIVTQDIPPYPDEHTVRTTLLVGFPCFLHLDLVVSNSHPLSTSPCSAGQTVSSLGAGVQSYYSHFQPQWLAGGLAEDVFRTGLVNERLNSGTSVSRDWVSCFTSGRCVFTCDISRSEGLLTCVPLSSGRLCSLISPWLLHELGAPVTGAGHIVRKRPIAPAI